jgi:IS1 family transposase
VQVAYMWSYDYSYKLIRHELNIGSSSLVDWGNFFRDLAVEWNNVVRLPLGGIDPDDGLGLVIEIDESAFGKNKYNRGRKPTTRWVFGGIERATGRLFAQTVLNRNANTLIPLIQQHIAWGSHIISDGWAAYDSIPSDVYTHSVVIHADNFVAPHDACIHTQNIESAWSRMKHKLKCHRGTSQALFDSYIAEHVWRSYRDCDCKFSYLIAEIIRQYPF